jgi:hypothetical protein
MTRCTDLFPFGPPHSRYKGRGLFLDPPTAGLVRGSWQVRLPGTWPEAAEQLPADELSFETFDALLDPARGGSALAKLYTSLIDDAITRYSLALPLPRPAPFAVCLNPRRLHFSLWVWVWGWGVNVSYQ